MLLRSGGSGLLVDITRDFPEQSPLVDRAGTVLLTHGHRDACGGIPALRRWLAARTVPVVAHPATIDVLHRRYRRLEHCDFRPAEPGTGLSLDGWEIHPVLVPHSRDPAFPTYAYVVSRGGSTLTYASDVAELTPDLERAARRSDVLVLDGATWGRRIVWHLRMDEDVAAVCGWDVGRILLTQIGRTAPPHEMLADRLADLCPRATPAYDGLEIDV